MSIQNLSGQTLGQYELRDLLGAGGMGAVYRGYQSNLKRYVAIKVLTGNLSEQPGALERFNREAQTSAALEHAHIIRIYDYGTQRGISYLVMQLLTGGSLQERIAQRAGTDRPLPSLGEVSGLLKQVASALDYAHSQGVIHRDIKPSNVMFDNHGAAYLVDFGIAKLVQATSGLTASGMVIGTWGYMAPEQWKAETLTPATDQYALAVMTYALIAGQMPFDAPTPAGVMHKHLNDMPTPVHTYRPDVPEAVTAVIERALSKRQGDRFPSVTAFAQAFEKAIRGQTGEVTGFFTTTVRRKPQPTAFVTPSQPVTAARPIYKHPVVWGLVAVLVVALAVIALLLSSGGGEKSGQPGATAAVLIASDTPRPAIIIQPSATETPLASPTPASGLTVFSPTPGRSPSPTETPPTWTNTPPPTVTPLPTLTWTNTPPPTETPDLEATVEALMGLHLTQTAESWTETPSPTETITPDLLATAEAVVIARLTATADAWTETPSPTMTPPLPALPPTFTQESPSTRIPTVSASAAARLNGLVYQAADWDHAGIASLTTALSYYGWDYDQEASQSVLQPNASDPNVSPAEMVMYVNQQTILPNVKALYRYGGDFELIERALSAGFPIVIESGIEVDGLGWMGHYETLMAYNAAAQTVWVYDSVLGDRGDTGWTYRYDDLDARWRQFNRVFILFFPLDREKDVRAVLGPYVDPAYAAQMALEQATQEVAADPYDGWAWFNLGTSSAKLGEYSAAAFYFDKALRQGLPWRLLWYQFGPYEAYYNVGRYDDLIQVANNTAATTEYVEETYYWRGIAQAALGQRDAALSDFSRALDLNPNYSQAQEARDRLEAGTLTAPASPVPSTLAPAPLPSAAATLTLPDLTISALSGVTDVTLSSSGTTQATYAIRVKNLGPGASYPTRVAVLQPDGQLVYIDFPSLQPDEEIQIPADGLNVTFNAPGVMRILVTVDDQNIVTETSETNNQAYMDIVVARPTPEATATGLAAETPPFTPPAEGVWARALTDRVNVRTGPGVMYDVMGTITPDAPRQVLGTNPDRNWLVIEFSGAIGWVSDTVVSVYGDLNTVPLISAPPTPTSTALPVTAAATPAASSAAGLIAFESNRDGNGEIYVMNTDGSNPHNLTQHSADDFAPDWSPDGSRIAFQSNRDGNSEIYVMNADGSNPRNLTQHSADDWLPAWSPDGSRIAFSSTRDGMNTVYVMSADGSNPRRLTNSGAADWSSSWSPDGGQIAFASGRDDNIEIYVMNADGSNPRRLTNNSAPVDEAPAWSPDGRQIAFQSNRDLHYDIYVMNADGSSPRNLTNTSVDDYSPDWSPDGRQIAFESYPESNGEIYVMNADGSSPRNLTNHSAHDGSPAWQPVTGAAALPTPAATPIGGGSGEIVFLSEREGGWNLFLMNADGTNIRRLTYLNQMNAHPSWSPDGRQMVFRSNNDAELGIYVMNADGSQVRLLSYSRYDNDPDWSPDGQHIAFVSLRAEAGSYDIYVMDSDGSNIRRLTDYNGDDDEPTWSPDGTQIAFTSDRDGVDGIYAMNADGSNVRRLIAHARNPAWSPDGTQMAFISTDDQLYIANTNGDNPRRLTDFAVGAWEPAWSPDGTQIAFGAVPEESDMGIYVINVDGSNLRQLTGGSAHDGYPAWRPVLEAASSATPNAAALPAPPRLPPELDAIKTGLVTVNGGQFAMGTTPEEAQAALDECALYGKTCTEISLVYDSLPVRPVTLDTFQMEVYEVNLSQYVAFLNWKGPNSHKNGCAGQPCAYIGQEAELSLITFDGTTYSVTNAAFNANTPATYVTWWGAVAYCEALNRRLPTEAEWEHAARGEADYSYPWGNEFDPTRAMSAIDANKGIVPVDSYPAGASPYGIFNLAGNVAEWVSDWYQVDYYTQQAGTNPQGPVSGTEKVLRGGSWDTIPLFLRTVHRMSASPGVPTAAIGFRCAQSVETMGTAALVTPPPDMTLSPVATLAANGANVLAYCAEKSVTPPKPTTVDQVVVEWSWFVAQPELMDAHLANARYEVWLDGNLLDNWSRYASAMRQEHGVWFVYWYYPVGQLAAGEHRIDYRLTWAQAVTDGYSEYGPGTAQETETGHCNFSVTG